MAALHLLLVAHHRRDGLELRVLQALTMACFGLVGANAGALAMEPLGHIAGTASALQGLLSTVGGALIGLVIGQSFNGIDHSRWSRVSRSAARWASPSRPGPMRGCRRIAATSRPSRRKRRSPEARKAGRGRSAARLPFVAGPRRLRFRAEVDKVDATPGTGAPSPAVGSYRSSSASGPVISASATSSVLPRIERSSRSATSGFSLR